MLLWIMLPAYNEAVSLRRLLPKLDEVCKGKKQDYRVVVINDGSIDETGNVLNELQEKYPVSVISHLINRGLGETERDGFEFIANACKCEDIIVRMDCDDTHEPIYLFNLLAKIEEGYDVVSASRFQPGGDQLGVNQYRAFISYCANIFMKVLFNIKGIKDYSCGYRAYKGSVLKNAVNVFGNGFIQLKGLGFTSTLETIVKLKLLGCNFAEVPFVLRYDQKASVSKMVSSVTTLGYFVMGILYHWPFGGWRIFYKDLAREIDECPEMAIEKFSYTNLKRSSICKIGG